MLEENHNSNSTYDLFSQDSEKLLVIHSMIKMTLDFFQPEQFTRSFNWSSENMTYLLEIQRNYYLFTQWLKWHNIFSITGIIYSKLQTSIKILNLYLLQNFKHFLLCIFSYQEDISLVNIQCLRYQSKLHPLWRRILTS